MTSVKTSIKAWGEVEKEALQRYGSGTEVLRLGYDSSHAKMNGMTSPHGLKRCVATGVLVRAMTSRLAICIKSHGLLGKNLTPLMGCLGHTGLLEALATAYLAARRDTASISWIHNHSRNTQLALLSGDIDIALTYERDQEDLAQSEGWWVRSAPDVLKCYT